ncbi:tRNA(adenine34) deaminase [Batrachochytrium dendrobatidis]|nr:tRNA(adenine34) deaminase [Batrachochytrium dendrobatidis]KAK5669941.1 tRNA(adenine34) deaminase [Batrachochytrium dendrobatidis]
MQDLFNQDDKKYMTMALQLASDAYDVGEVPVGCVFVHASKGIIGQGRNRTNESLNGVRHAEFEAIDQIMSMRPLETDLDTYVKTTFPQTDVYVTVEPCIMCASALRHLQIRRVVFGCGNDKFGGCGSVFHIHDDGVGAGFNYPAVGGLFKNEAIMALRRFYVRENSHAPVPRKKTNRVLKET